MKRTSAPYSVGGRYIDRNPATGTTGTKGIAEDKNIIQEEICSPIEALGITLDGSEEDQLYKAIVGLSHVVGEMVMLETEDTPGEFFPAVPRNVDNDISATNYPLLVPKLRAVKAKVLGVTDFSCTVSGSTVTIADTPAGNKLINLLQSDCLVAGWLNQSQAANFTADYTTASTQRCINIAGTDYAITGVTVVSRQFTVSGTPASGSQTASVYTYRIAGEANKARLHKIAGFVGVVAGDVDGEVVGGWRKMDRTQLHGHIQNMSADNSPGASSNNGYSPISELFSVTNTSNGSIGAPVETGAGGSPRNGKTTDPRTAGQYVYTWAGVYNAA